MKTLRGGIASGLRLGTLGFKVKGVTPSDIINDSEFFSEILVRNKMLGFIDLNPTPEEHQAIVKALYRGETENCIPGMLFDQYHKQNQDTLTDDQEWFIMANWHMDNPFGESIPSYTSIHMHTFTCSPDVGQTHFLSLISLYDKCPEKFKEKLQTARFLGETGRYGDSANEPVVSHPALRTHPVTSETILFWSGPATELEGGSEPWFEELKDWIHGEMLDPANRYTWHWKQGDLILWDNRALLHSLSAGWSHDQRIFNRCESSPDKPFYDPNHPHSLNPDFGDIIRVKGVEKDQTTGPNPDHIPLVFTKGVYALPEWEHLYQKVVMFVYSKDGTLPDDVIRFQEIINHEDFYAIPIVPQEKDFLTRFSLDGVEKKGQKFIFNHNGDLDRAFSPEYDIFTTEYDELGRWPPVPLVQSLLTLHPDLRHAGHAWHYPCWFDHQSLKYRPWSWHHLSFMEYEDFGGAPPPFHFLVQFAIDTVYGCFNHYESSEDRKKMIDAIRDYLEYMVELKEYENDR